MNSQVKALLVIAVLCASVLFGAVGSASAADPVEVGSFGGSGTPDGSFDNTKIAVDEVSGDVYVIDAAHDAVDRFSSTGTYISQIKGSDTTAGSFQFATDSQDGITVDGSGNLYVVSDLASFSKSTSVFKFDSSGAKLWEQPVADARTCGVDVDSNGRLWVADESGQRLIELSPSDGTATGTTITPQGIAPCAIAFDDTGAFYASARGNDLHKFDATGTSLQTLVAPPNIVTDVETDSKTKTVFSSVLILNPSFERAARQWDAAGNVVSSIPFALGASSLTGVAVDSSRGRLYVNDQQTQTIQIYTLPVSPPTVTPVAASSVTTNSATLNAEVNPNSEDVTECEFEYGLTTTYGSQAPCSPPPPISGEDPIAVSAAITGLLPNTTYHFHVVATNAGGTVPGDDVFFKTKKAPPTVTTGAAAALTRTTATLAGTANPNGDATTCAFQYGASTAYGSELAVSPAPGSGQAAVDVGVSLTGLSAGSTYHYRLHCSNGAGPGDGDDATFTTSPDTCATNAALCPPPPKTCATDPSLCPPPPPPVISCVVPKLKGFSLGKAKSSLVAAHCTAGKVTKPKKKKGALVVKSSSPASGATLPAGSKVNLKLAPKPKKKH